MVSDLGNIKNKSKPVEEADIYKLIYKNNSNLGYGEIKRKIETRLKVYFCYYKYTRPEKSTVAQ